MHTLMTHEQHAHIMVLVQRKISPALHNNIQVLSLGDIWDTTQNSERKIWIFSPSDIWAFSPFYSWWQNKKTTHQDTMSFWNLRSESCQILFLLWHKVDNDISSTLPVSCSGITQTTKHNGVKGISIFHDMTVTKTNCLVLKLPKRLDSQFVFHSMEQVFDQLF